MLNLSYIPENLRSLTKRHQLVTWLSNSLMTKSLRFALYIYWCDLVHTLPTQNEILIINASPQPDDQHTTN